MNSDTLLQLEQRLIEQVAAVRGGDRDPRRAADLRMGGRAGPDRRGTGVLHGWIGGGCSRAIVIQAAQQAIRTGLPKRVRISNERRVGRRRRRIWRRGSKRTRCRARATAPLELFIQPTVPAPSILVLGSTPTALEACVLAQRVGLRVSAAAAR